LIRGGRGGGAGTGRGKDDDVDVYDYVDDPTTGLCGAVEA
jgi:hypothetical protein